MDQSIKPRAVPLLHNYQPCEPIGKDVEVKAVDGALVLSFTPVGKALDPVFMVNAMAFARGLR